MVISPCLSLSAPQLFIMALAFAYFSKALAGSYMKSAITQIERRFELSTTHVGMVDGSFEMGEGGGGHRGV